MIDDFEKYISSFPKLADDDLYMDIDETMELRKIENPKAEMTKGYAPKKK